MHTGLGLRHDRDPRFFVVIRMFRPQLRHERRHSVAHGRDVQLRLDSRDHIEGVVVARLPHPFTSGARFVHLHQRDPEDRRHDRYDALERFGRDADDFVILTVQDDMLADDRLVATEHALPAGVADHSHAMGEPSTILRRNEEPSPQRRDAQDGEVVRGCEHPEHPARIAGASGQIQRIEAPERHTGKRFGGAIAKILIVRNRVGPVLHVARPASIELHDLLRRLHARQRPQQERVDRGEHRRIEPDRERQR